MATPNHEIFGEAKQQISIKVTACEIAADTVSRKKQHLSY
jgi:peroxiredoxin family protein